MPKSNDTVHLRFTLKGETGPFWQTNATVASVANGTALLDGLDRQIAARLADFRRAGWHRASKRTPNSRRECRVSGTFVMTVHGA